MATAQQRLKQGLNHALDALNVGARFGYCSQTEVQSWSAELEFLRELAGEDFNFWRHDAAIVEIRQRLNSRRAVAVDEARGRLERIENVKPKQRARVEKVLADGDVQTANDYLERLTSGRTLPEPTIADAPSTASSVRRAGFTAGRKVSAEKAESSFSSSSARVRLENHSSFPSSQLVKCARRRSRWWRLGSSCTNRASSPSRP